MSRKILLATAVCALVSSAPSGGNMAVAAGLDSDDPCLGFQASVRESEDGKKITFRCHDILPNYPLSYTTNPIDDDYVTLTDMSFTPVGLSLKKHDTVSFETPYRDNYYHLDNRDEDVFMEINRKKRKTVTVGDDTFMSFHRRTGWINFSYDIGVRKIKIERCQNAEGEAVECGRKEVEQED